MHNWRAAICTIESWQCATASQRAKTILSLDRPEQREALAANLDNITKVPPPVLIDEWQLEPAVWDRVKTAVDQDSTGGRFLLAGSAGVAPGVRIHSGAGRIVSVKLRPLAFSERDLVEPTVSLRSLLTGAGADVSGHSPIGLPVYTDEILASGLPGIRHLPERARTVQLDSYIARIFVLDPVPAWIPIFNPLRRLTRTPKHHLVDPALAARLVKVSRDGLLRGEGERVADATGSWLGALFESLVAQSVRVYAEAIDAHVGHLRTRDTTHEIDLIVEGSNRRILAVEVKLAATVDDADVRHLNWLQKQIGDQLADRIVITTGPYAYRRDDGVAVVPLALLGP